MALTGERKRKFRWMLRKNVEEMDQREEKPLRKKEACALSLRENFTTSGKKARSQKKEAGENRKGKARLGRGFLGDTRGKG